MSAYQPRSENVLDAARQAAAAGMKGLGLMDNFGNSSGLAALAMDELGHLGIDVFSGIILTRRIDVEIVPIALEYGYGQNDGARFVSLPTHHTQNIALSETRTSAYIDSCCAVLLAGDLPDRLLEGFDLIAQREVVLNTGPQIALTNVDADAHRAIPVTLEQLLERIQAAGAPWLRQGAAEQASPIRERH